MNKRVTVTELVAFARCEHKAQLIQQKKGPNRNNLQDRTPAQNGVITHAIIERKNRT